MLFVFAGIADWILSNQYMRVTPLRKLMQTIGECAWIHFVASDWLIYELFQFHSFQVANMS